MEPTNGYVILPDGGVAWGPDLQSSEDLLSAVRRLDSDGMLVTFGMLDREGLKYSDTEVLSLARSGKVSLCECSDPAHYQTRLVRAHGKAWLGLAIRG